LGHDCPDSHESPVAPIHLDSLGHLHLDHYGRRDHCGRYHRLCGWENQNVNQNGPRPDVIQPQRQKLAHHETADDQNRPYPIHSNRRGSSMRQKVYGDRVRSLAQHRFF
jgi:hypothetical protein